MEYYIYVYLNIENEGNYKFGKYKFKYEPFYVGKGKGKRSIYHLRKSVMKNTPFYSKLKSMKTKGIKPIIEILDYFDNEIDAYNKETELIKLIGSNYISEIKNGSLKNMCLTSKPPNHKGKTYEEIYGDKAEFEREKRKKTQIERGGFFKGRKHTKESREKISRAVRGKNNPMFGKPVSEIRKKRISEANSDGKFAHDKNPNSKKFIAISPDGIKYRLNGNVKSFCIKMNLSYSTLTKTLRTNKKPNKGKTKDWLLIYNT
jgi:hypothetical protein